MATSLASGRPPTACRQCKKQKVRCSGDCPSCKRCLRSGMPCIYAPRKRTYLCRPRDGTQSSTGADTVTARLMGNPSLLNEDSTALRSPGYLGIPETVVSKLVDTYFSHSYNAQLLLHKIKFREERQRGVVRNHVLLAVCAMGAIFHTDEQGELPFKDFAQMWAERAGKLVFNKVEDPRADNIVTFITLALFWYMQGSWRRSYMNKGNAMQTAHVLNLIGRAGRETAPLDAELSRRRFWACYLINCHTSNSMFSISPAPKLDRFPLPWKEDAFEAGSPEGTPVTFGSGSTNGGIYSELIRAMTHWSAVDSLLKTTGSSHLARLATIHQLDSEIQKWWARLPPNLQLNSTTLATFRRVDLTKLLLVHIAYHQCLCALHASIVPLFTWGPHPTTSALAQQFSAQVAYDNAYVAPYYPLAAKILLGANVVAIAATGLAMFVCRRANERKRDAAYRHRLLGEVSDLSYPEQLEKLGDHHPEFRYVL